MELNIRRYEHYAIVSISVGGTNVDLGMLNRNEVQELRDQIESALQEAERFLEITPK